MVRADMMQAIDNSLRLNRGNRQPFGGVRMILSGDLHQLPPVVGADVEHILQESYGGAWFFKAPGFVAGQFRLAALKRIFRQEDAAFIRILNALRNGRLSVEDEEVLKTRVSDRSSAEASITHVVLTPNNAAAWKINQLRLAELPGPARAYSAALEGNFDGYRFALANAAKDIGYYEEMAGKLGCATRLTESVAEIFRQAVETGHGGRNVSHLLDPAIDDVT